MVPRRHRIGFIGMGGCGRSHLRILRDWYGDRVLPAAAADPGPQYLTRWPVQAFGWPEEIPGGRRFADYRDLLALDDVEAVIIATYESTHLEIALAALDAGKAVLLEKAAIVSFAEAEALYTRLRAGPARFMLGLNLRHHEVVRTLRRLFREEAIGRVVCAATHVNTGHAAGSVLLRMFYRDAALSGDEVLNKLTHDSDAVHHVLGTYAETVSGTVAKTTFVPRPGAGRVCRECSITTECHEYVDVYATAQSRAEHEARLALGLEPADICPYTTESTSHDTAAFSGVLANGAVYSLVMAHAGPVYQRRYHFDGTGGEIVATIGGREGDTVVCHPLGAEPASIPIAAVPGPHGGADPRLVGSFLDYLDRGEEAPHEAESVLTSVMLPLGGLQAAAESRTVSVGEWYRSVLARASSAAQALAP